MSLDDFGFVGHRAGGSQFHAGAGPTPESEIHGYGLVGFRRYSKGPSLSTLPGFFFPRVHVISVPHLHPDRGSINGRGFPGVEAIVEENQLSPAGCPVGRDGTPPAGTKILQDCDTALA
jgi:hypothetical protein